MNRRHQWMARRLPPGVDAPKLETSLLVGLAAALLFHLQFILRYWSARNDLYTYYQGHIRRLNGTMMPVFGEILGTSLYGCFVAALAMIVVAIQLYATHFQGSKSIYTMRRLPDRWELWRRVLTIPVLAAAGFLLLAFVLRCLDFTIYILFTPGQCLYPYTWAELLNLF